LTAARTVWNTTPCTAAAVSTFVHELRPDEVEDPLGEQPGQDPDDDPDGAIDELQHVLDSTAARSRIIPPWVVPTVVPATGTSPRSS
jgi:hypothetical protein